MIFYIFWGVNYRLSETILTFNPPLPLEIIAPERQDNDSFQLEVSENLQSHPTAHGALF